MQLINKRRWKIPELPLIDSSDRGETSFMLAYIVKCKMGMLWLDDLRCPRGSFCATPENNYIQRHHSRNAKCHLTIPLLVRLSQSTAWRSSTVAQQQKLFVCFFFCATIKSRERSRSWVECRKRRAALTDLHLICDRSDLEIPIFGCATKEEANLDFLSIMLSIVRWIFYKSGNSFDIEEKWKVKLTKI